MKKIIQLASGIAASAVIATAIVPAVSVFAWGDSDGGRPSYTLDQINSGKLGNKVVLNSISDNPNIGGSEKNFVGAREDTGINNGNGVWKDSIKIEDGKTYLVRMYIHNNSPKGYDAVAKGVTSSFNVPNTASKSIEVNGFINSTNASPREYWDNTTFTSDKDFYLSYVPGSALLENNGIGKNGGIKLGDAIVTKAGVPVGYSALNGEVPGCFQYDNYVTIKVKAYNTTSKFALDKQVRIKGQTEWKESVNAKVGDTVEYQLGYRNMGNTNQMDVTVIDQLPKGMSYVAGSTKIKDGARPNGAKVADGITTNGLVIGSYAPGANAFITFEAKIQPKDTDLVCGVNQFKNIGQIFVGEARQDDDASVNVAKECEKPIEKCDIEGKTHLDKNDPDCKKTETPVTPPKELPKTGATSIVSGVVGLASIATAGAYYIRSRKQL